MKRCSWVENQPEFYQKYHDEEWGVELHDDFKLFEMLILEGAQAGLSWSTILRKRENYHHSFDEFNFFKIADYKQQKIEELLKNPGIVRNKLKIISAIKNARVVIEIAKEFNSFDKYLWSFIDFKPINNHINSSKEIITQNKISDRISKDLKNRGMNFVGSKIIYAFMQAIGMVNDHETSCFCYQKTDHPIPEIG